MPRFTSPNQGSRRPLDLMQSKQGNLDMESRVRSHKAQGFPDLLDEIGQTASPSLGLLMELWEIVHKEIQGDIKGIDS